MVTGSLPPPLSSSPLVRSKYSGHGNRREFRKYLGYPLLTRNEVTLRAAAWLSGSRIARHSIEGVIKLLKAFRVIYFAYFNLDLALVNAYARH